MDAALGQVCSVHCSLICIWMWDAYGLGVLDTLKNPFNQPTPLVGSIEITKQTSPEPAEATAPVVFFFRGCNNFLKKHTILPSLLFHIPFEVKSRVRKKCSKGNKANNIWKGNHKYQTIPPSQKFKFASPLKHENLVHLLQGAPYFFRCSTNHRNPVEPTKY